jgi:predicted MFS family arabinose efflux permease
VAFGEPPAERGRRADEIRAGVLWLWRQPLVRFLALLTSGIDCVMAGTSLIVIVAAQNAHASAFGIGLILAGGSIGALCAAVVAPRLRGRFGFARVALASLWALTLIFPLYALAGGPLPLGVVTALAFSVYALYDITQFSERLVLIPDALQGRVNSIFRLLVFMGIPLGQVIKGALLQSLGPQRTVLIFSGPLLLLAVLATLAPNVRRAGARSAVAPMGRLEHSEQLEPAGD